MLYLITSGEYDDYSVDSLLEGPSHPFEFLPEFRQMVEKDETGYQEYADRINAAQKRISEKKPHLRLMEPSLEEWFRVRYFQEFVAWLISEHGFQAVDVTETNMHSMYEDFQEKR